MCSVFKLSFPPVGVIIHISTLSDMPHPSLEQITPSMGPAPMATQDTDKPKSIYYCQDGEDRKLADKSGLPFPSMICISGPFVQEPVNRAEEEVTRTGGPQCTNRNTSLLTTSHPMHSRHVL